MKIRIVMGTLGLVMTLAVTASGCDNGADGSGGSGGDGVGGGKPTSGAGQAQQPFTAGSRLKVRQVAGADGSIQQIGLYDSELETACSFGLADDGSTRCLPSGAPGGVYWADAACTVPTGASACSAPKYVTIAASTCGGGTSVYQATALYTGLIYSLTPGGVCSAQGDAQGKNLYSTTGKVAAASFVQGTEETK